MALGASDLKKGSAIVVDGTPYVVLTVSHSHVGRGGAVFQSKIKNLKTGNILERNFKPGDSVETAKISKMQAVFIYERRPASAKAAAGKGEYWFHQLGKPANRFSIGVNALENKAALLKPRMEVLALKFTKDDEEEIINIELPVKADYKVTHAPPNIRGSTADGGRKIVTIEGGLKVNVPLFIREGDTIRINTETGEYAERVGS